MLSGGDASELGRRPGSHEARPDDRDYILEQGGDSMRYLSENSILFNVQGPARDLLTLLGSPG